MKSSIRKEGSKIETPMEGVQLQTHKSSFLHIIRALTSTAV